MSLEGNAETTNTSGVLRGKIHSLSPYAVDKTLSVEGAGADAKATGEAIAKATKEATAAAKVAQETAEKAQKTAEEAKSAAEDGSGSSSLNGGTATGDIDMDGYRIKNLPAPEAEGDVVNKNYVDQIAESIDKWTESDVDDNGDKVNNLSAGGKTLVNVAEPVSDTDAANKKYVDDAVTTVNQNAGTAATAAAEAKNLANAAVKRSGDAMEGNLDLAGYGLKHVANPTSDADAANKAYVDALGTVREVLYVNSDVSTEFAAQTITAEGLSEFDEIRIECSSDTGYDEVGVIRHTETLEYRAEAMCVFQSTFLYNSAAHQLLRSFTLSGNTIKVSDCGIVSGGSLTTANKCLIPTRVVGFKYGSVSADGLPNVSGKPEITYERAEGGFWNTTNTWVAGDGYYAARTNVIPVTPGDKLSYMGYGAFQCPGVIWYSDSMSILSYETDDAHSAAVTKTAPAGAGYAQFFSYSTEGEATLVVGWVLCQAYDGENVSLGTLYGKKICYDGDSICYGYNSGGYAKLIAERFSGKYDNQGQGGGRLITQGSGSYHSVVDNLTNLPTDADLYCFEGGINDYWNDAALGTFDYTNFTGSLDTSTVCGALETIFRYCLNNFVGKPVCFVITHKIQETAYEANGNGNTFKNYRDAMVGICEKYSIPYYDAFTESGLNGWNTAQSNAYLNANTSGTADGCHPNEEGYKRYYVPQLIDLFERIMPIDTESTATGGSTSGGGTSGDSSSSGDDSGGDSDDDSTSGGTTGSEYNLLLSAVDGDGNVCPWKEDTRWSGSAGAEATKEGTYLSGYIPYTPGKGVYLSNVTMLPDSTSAVHYFSDIGTRIGGTDGATVLSHWSGVTNDEGNLVYFKMFEDDSWATTTYIRIECTGFDDTSAVYVY